MGESSAGEDATAPLRIVTRPTHTGFLRLCVVRDTTLPELEGYVATSRSGWILWERIMGCLALAMIDRRFSYMFVRGAFASGERMESHAAITLQVAEPISRADLELLQLQFADIRERVMELYSIRIDLWVEHLPHDLVDNGYIFRSEPPGHAEADEAQAIARINLRDFALPGHFRVALDPFAQGRARQSTPCSYPHQNGGAAAGRIDHAGPARESSCEPA